MSQNVGNNLEHSILPKRSLPGNPFYHRTPIRDQRFFFGRTLETRLVLDYVSQKQSVSIVGPCRIGKSSLLFHLCDPEVRAAHGLGDDYAFVYIDCQLLLGDLAKSDVYGKLLEEIIEATQEDHSAEHEFEGAATDSDLERRLDEITASGLQVVLLFDEFEAMAGNHQLGGDFFSDLQGLSQTGRVVYVTASRETLSDLSFHGESNLSSSFCNIFSTVWLGFMRPQEARAMVDDLAAMADFGGFDENDHAFLQEVAGPHPFYLQVACYLLFEEKIERSGPTPLDYDLVKRQFAREARGHFHFAWGRLSDDERRALRLIGQNRLDDVAAENRERLSQKCLVYQDAIFSSSFAEFVNYSAE